MLMFVGWVGGWGNVLMAVMVKLDDIVHLSTN
jgi:hypothetical protein